MDVQSPHDWLGLIWHKLQSLQRREQKKTRTNVNYKMTCNRWHK